MEIVVAVLCGLMACVLVDQYLLRKRLREHSHTYSVEMPPSYVKRLEALESLAEDDDTDIDDPTDLYDDDEDSVIDCNCTCPCDLDNAVERLHEIAGKFEAAQAATNEPAAAKLSSADVEKFEPIATEDIFQFKMPPPPPDTVPRFNALKCPGCGLPPGAPGYDGVAPEPYSAVCGGASGCVSDELTMLPTYLYLVVAVLIVLVAIEFYWHDRNNGPRGPMRLA